MPPTPLMGLLSVSLPVRLHQTRNTSCCSSASLGASRTTLITLHAGNPAKSRLPLLLDDTGAPHPRQRDGAIDMSLPSLLLANVAFMTCATAHSICSTGTNAGMLMSPDLPPLRAKVWPARLGGVWGHPPPGNVYKFDCLGTVFFFNLDIKSQSSGVFK